MSVFYIHPIALHIAIKSKFLNLIYKAQYGIIKKNICDQFFLNSGSYTLSFHLIPYFFVS